MLPRRAQLSHWLLAAMAFVLCIWVWIISPQEGSDLHQRGLNTHLQTTLRHSTLDSVLDSLQNKSSESHIKEEKSHEVVVGRSAKKESSEQAHTNQTLEQLKHNMTMLKANMSGVGHIISSMNKSVDYVNVPNPHPFKYIINTESVCKGQDLFLIAYVHTAVDHYKRRMVIRQTWGHPKFYTDVGVRVVFVMGKTENKQAEDALQFEAEQYHDIVQEDFMDTYRNLTYKGIAALKWLSNYCPNAKYVLKSDDDIFVNTFTLLRHLKSIDRLQTDSKGLLLCLVWNRMKVMREGKWKVDREQFADDYYPTYCSGSAFTMSMDAAIAMHNISYQVPFFWVDDFYITGLLPLKLKGEVKHKQFMSTYVLDGRKLQEKFTGPQWFTYIFSHVHDLNAIQSVWDKLVSLANGAKRPPVKFALPGQLPNEAELRRKEKEEEDRKAKQRREEEKAKKAKKS